MRVGMRRFLLTATALALVVGAAGPARTSVLVSGTEVGGDVVFQGGGTLNLTGLSFVVQGTFGAAIAPSIGAISLGPVPGTPVDFYSGVTGPGSFGGGGNTVPSSGAGDRILVASLQSLLSVPQGYNSGAPLTTTSTFAGATFASLGATPGTYVWTWGTGVNADSFTLQIGPAAPAAAIPEPGTLALVLVGGMTTGAGFLRRRRRA